MTESPLPSPLKYKISGYTKKPHEYVTEIIDAGDWNRYQAGEGPKPLKQITDWVTCEEA